MANTHYTYATEFSTEHSLAQAYKEFYDHAVANYQVLINMVQEASDRVESESDPEAIAMSIIRENSNYEITDKTIVATNEGVMYLKDVLQSAAAGVQGQLISIDAEGVSSIDFDISVPRIQDSPLVIKLSSLFDEMNNTLHAITVEQAIGLAYAAGETVAERVALARDAIASVFSSAFTDFSTCLQDAIGCLKNGMSLSQYIVRRMKRSGIQAMAEFEVPITSSDDVEYAGASIWGGVMWQTTNNYIVDAVVNVGKAIAMAGMTLFNWIKTGATWVLNKVTGWEQHTFVNPVDFEVINKQGNHTTDLFAFDGHMPFHSNWIDSPFVKKLLEGPVHCDFIPCEIVATIDPAKYHTVASRWTNVVGRLKLIADSPDTPNTWIYDDEKSILENVNAWMNSSYTDIQLAIMYLTDHDPSMYEEYPPIMELLRDYLDNSISWDTNIGHVYVKIKPIKWSYMQDLLNSGAQVNYHEAISAFENMIKFQDTYAYGDPITDVSVVQDATEEHNVFYDFIAGTFFTKLLLEVLYHESNGGQGDPAILSTGSLNDAIDALFSHAIADWPSNAMFLGLLVDGELKYGSTVLYDFKLDVAGYDFARVLFQVFEQQEQNPFNMEFFPYTHNEVTWYEPMFRIKTDTEHQVELANFIVKAAAVVIAVVITVAVVKKIRTKAVAANLQAEGALWNCTEAASKGQLTDELVKTYRKKALKAKIINFLSGNLLAASGKAGSSLIQGTGVIKDVSEGYISEITTHTDTGISSIRRLIKR